VIAPAQRNAAVSRLGRRNNVLIAASVTSFTPIGGITSSNGKPGIDQMSRIGHTKFSVVDQKLWIACRFNSKGVVWSHELGLRLSQVLIVALTQVDLAIVPVKKSKQFCRRGTSIKL